MWHEIDILLYSVLKGNIATAGIDAGLSTSSTEHSQTLCGSLTQTTTVCVCLAVMFMQARDKRKDLSLNRDTLDVNSTLEQEDTLDAKSNVSVVHLPVVG